MGQVFGKGHGNEGKGSSNKEENPIANMSLANGTNLNNMTHHDADKPTSTNVFCKKKKAIKDGIRRKIEDLEFQLKSTKVAHLVEIEAIRKELRESNEAFNSNMKTRMDAVESVVLSLIQDLATFKAVSQKNTEQYNKTVGVVVEALSKSQQNVNNGTSTTSDDT